MELKARVTVLVGVAFLLVAVAAAVPLQAMSGMMEAIALIDERASAISTVQETAVRVEEQAWEAACGLRAGLSGPGAAAGWRRVLTDAAQAGALAGIRISPLLEARAFSVADALEQGLLAPADWEETVAGDIAPAIADELGRMAIGLRSANLMELDALVQSFSRARAVVPIVTFMALLMALVVMTGVGRWLLRPIRGLVEVSGYWSRGRLEARAPVVREDELGRLAQAMNRMAEQLGSLQARLADAQRLAALGEMTSAVSHNIRNPLAGVRSAAQLLSRHTEGEDRELAEGIVDSVDNLERWMQNLLHLDEDGQKAWRPEPRLLSDLVDRATQAVSPVAAGKGVALRVDDGSDGGSILCEPALLEQAFIAVLNNAIEASPEDGEVRVRLAPRPYLNREGWEIEILDKGDGFPDELVPRVFDPYFSTKTAGLGLGLPGAMRIARRHGGVVEVEGRSRVAGGCVRFRLPVEAAAHPEAARENG